MGLRHRKLGEKVIVGVGERERAIASAPLLGPPPDPAYAQPNQKSGEKGLIASFLAPGCV